MSQPPVSAPTPARSAVGQPAEPGRVPFAYRSQAERAALGAPLIRELGEEHVQQEPFRLEQLRLSVQPDFMVLRSREQSSAFQDLATRGTACGTAADMARCEERVARAERQVEADPSVQDAVYVLTLSGEEPRVWLGPRELKQLLGEIDTAAEARLWLYAERKLWPACGLQLPACERALADGFEIRSRVEHRCGATLFTHHVARSGAVKVLARSDAPGPCGIP
ncbi:MAG: hypothetical protein QM778_16000 [Myxococcales bacterium]